MKQDKQTLLTGASLAALTFFLTAQTADAGQCYTMPTCETMGYTETTCVDKTAIKCPFDTSKMKCVVNANPTSSCPEGYGKNTAGECVNDVDIYYCATNPMVCGISYGELIFSADASEALTYTEAEKYCANLRATTNLSNGLVWRLPTFAELLSIPLTSVAQMKAVGSLANHKIFTKSGYWTQKESDKSHACQRSFPLSPKFTGSCVGDVLNSTIIAGVVCVTTTRF